MCIPDTPVGKDKDIYKYFCPICFMYYKEIHKTTCCKNYVCFPCALAHVNRRMPCNPLLTVLPDQVLPIGCPACAISELLFVPVDQQEPVRAYFESPHTKELIDAAEARKNGLLQVEDADLSKIKKKMLDFETSDVVDASLPAQATWPASLPPKAPKAAKGTKRTNVKRRESLDREEHPSASMPVSVEVSSRADDVQSVGSLDGDESTDEDAPTPTAADERKRTQSLSHDLPADQKRTQSLSHGVTDDRKRTPSLSHQLQVMKLPTASDTEIKERRKSASSADVLQPPAPRPRSRSISSIETPLPLSAPAKQETARPVSQGRATLKHSRSMEKRNSDTDKEVHVPHSPLIESTRRVLQTSAVGGKEVVVAEGEVERKEMVLESP